MTNFDPDRLRGKEGRQVAKEGGKKEGGRLVFGISEWMNRHRDSS